MEHKNGLSTFIVGSLNGIICTALSQPFEVMKTSFILAPHKEASKGCKSIISSVSTIFKREGIKGFFRGFEPAIIRKIFSSGIYFYGLNTANQFFRPKIKNRVISNIITCNIAKIAENILTNPFLVIETRFQVIGFNEYKSLQSAFKSIYKTEGCRAFGKGMWITVLRDIPAMTLFYPLYEYIKKSFPNEILEKAKSTIVLETSIYSISSLVAALISVAITQPLDVISVRMRYQFHNVNKDQVYSNFINGLVKVVKNEGFAGLFKGLMMRMAKKSVTSMISFAIYDLYDNHRKK